MFEIKFYKDRHGRVPVKDYLRELRNSKDERKRKQADKITEYIDILSVEGKAAGEPYIKHIEKELWELRPSSDRIFFLSWLGDSFVLLHQFRKTTQKTPRREIEKAFREIAELKEKGADENG